VTIVRWCGLEQLGVVGVRRKLRYGHSWASRNVILSCTPGRSAVNIRRSTCPGRSLQVTNTILHDDILLIVIGTRNIPHQFFNPTIPLLITLSAKNMSRIGTARTFLRFNDQKGVPIIVILVRLLAFCRTLLSTYLGSGDRDGSEIRKNPR